MFPDDVASETRALRSGEALFRQGDSVKAIFRVEHGVIRMERSTYDGRPVILHRSRAGQFFAEAALFSQTYHCNAIAECACLVRCYSKAAVLRAVEENPVGATSLLAALAHQLHGLRHRLELRSVRSARERVLLMLELQAEPDGLVHLPGDIQDLAFDLGLTREVVYRTLSTLEKEGAIKRSPSSILLLKSAGI
jgi:CRP-like cAMP-binding protein